MSATDAILILRGRQASKRVTLSSYVGATAREHSETEANRWIKSLRLAQVDGQTLRDRFRYRDDSLWWFAELYLHKRGRIARLFQQLHGLDALVDAERPRSVRLVEPGTLLVDAARAVLARHGIELEAGFGARLPAWRDRARTRAGSLVYRASARLSVLGAARRGAPAHPVDIACFVHSAFWRAGEAPGARDRETYVGPVIDALGSRVPADRLALVGVGPRTSYRGRRWWHRLRELGDPTARSMPLVPIETLAAPHEVAPSGAIWRARHAIRRTLLDSESLRSASTIRGYDCWPIVAEELTGVAIMQLPWSTRAMDEAGAALDRLEPAASVTYAEAGGWGRAIALESRRRSIPMVGLQHGFIYRHWLNYLHEPDEMRPSTAHPADRGFPRPDVTLVYDDYAAEHLTTRGSFPANAIAVTGSPRLDALAATARRLGRDELAAVRASVGADSDRLTVLVASKFTQIGSELPALLEAAGACPDVQVVIKCHPAEVAAPYERLAAGRSRVSIAPPGADLAALLVIARAVVTVNSTVAIDAMALGAPALVIGLPSNLSPFVDEGAMAGAAAASEIGPQLHALLYDRAFRARLERRRAAFLRRYRIGSDGGATGRAAEVILERAAIRGQPPHTNGEDGS